MIRVDYRPLRNLSPLHQAILVAVDKLPSPVGSFDCLSVSKILLESALEGLLAWGLLVCIEGKYTLPGPGKECVQVWKDTNMTGSWEIADPVGWDLGKGKYWIRANHACLGDVGFNQENGRRTTYPDAVALHEKYKEALNGQREELRSKSLELAAAKETLLAHWLQQQQGLLGELAQKSPSSLMVESTFGYPPEPESLPPPTLAENQPVVSPGAILPGSPPQETPTPPPTEDAKPNPSSGSMFRRLLRLFRS